MEKDRTKLLIADDDTVTGLLLSENTRKWGYDPIVVTDGIEAVEVLQQAHGPRIAILDWLMPGMSGLDIVKKVRSGQEEIPHYLIMLTSKNDKQDIVTALNAGADDFITKPFDPSELKARLDVGKRMVTLNQKLSSALKNAEKLADFITHYDQATGLPNYYFLMEKLGETCSNPKHPLMLLLLNIDKFNLVNQVLGLEAGELLLNYVGARLKALVNEPHGIVTKLAADEFAIFVRLRGSQPGEANKQILHLADKIHRAMEEPYNIGGENITVRASIGAVIIGPGVDGTAAEFMRRADFSLRKAKKEGGNCTVIYDPAMEKEFRERYALERDLKKAIKNQELKLYLQMQCDHQHYPHGAEALLRWEHPEKGLVSPGIFIPIAEESELIIDISEWVLVEACSIINRLNGRDFTISVNLSPRHFRKEDFVQQIKTIVRDTGADPRKLLLEVTEGLMIHDIKNVIEKMDELSGLGIRFSIDDFGTGYSSLTYIKRLPISEIKIDRSFIQGIPADENDTAIVNAIIAIGNNMNLKIVAEGVETREQVNFLKSRDPGILYQGFLFSRPGPWQEVMDKIQGGP